MTSKTIAFGYPQRTDATAFIVGITGLGLGLDGKLYVAETLTNQIFSVSDPLTRPGSTGVGSVVTHGNQLNGPLGLAIAPNGHILTVNASDGKIVETTPAGLQIFHTFLDTSGSPPGSGALFGLAVRPDLGGVYYVDDAVNTLRLLHQAAGHFHSTTHNACAGRCGPSVPPAHACSLEAASRLLPVLPWFVGGGLAILPGGPLA